MSLLEFQHRVLEEAGDESNPLLERVKFLSILGSNIDEFFMVRVAGLKNQVEAGIHEPTPDGMTPRQQLDAIRHRMKPLIAEAHHCRERIFEALADHGIRVLNYHHLRESQKEYANHYFTSAIYPVLTPLAFDPGRPFPHISNLSLNLSVLIRDRRGRNISRGSRFPTRFRSSFRCKRAPGETGNPSALSGSSR